MDNNNNNNNDDRLLHEPPNDKASASSTASSGGDAKSASAASAASADDVKENPKHISMFTATERKGHPCCFTLFATDAMEDPTAAAAAVPEQPTEEKREDNTEGSATAVDNVTAAKGSEQKEQKEQKERKEQELSLPSFDNVWLHLHSLDAVEALVDFFHAHQQAGLTLRFVKPLMRSFYGQPAEDCSFVRIYIRNADPGHPFSHEHISNLKNWSFRYFGYQMGLAVESKQELLDILQHRALLSAPTELVWFLYDWDGPKSKARESDGPPKLEEADSKDGEGASLQNADNRSTGVVTRLLGPRTPLWEARLDMYKKVLVLLEGFMKANSKQKP